MSDDVRSLDQAPDTRGARWSALEDVFQRALEQAPAQRRAFLDAACSDAEAVADVEALLAAHERRGPLDDLVDEVMTPLLTPASAAARTETPLPPTHARYRVLDRLGGGGMGMVFRARDDRLGRDVALKFLSPHLSADPVAKRRFLVEARAAAALEHPNICTVHEIGDTADGQIYIVMACYAGETLDKRIARGPLPVAEAVRVATDLARALQKAHERGIIHRDVKPANVMCTADGPVKLLDFGIAKLADVAVTQTIGAVGTVAYMSPEQAFGESVDARTDLWSLGVVLYEMLAGARPFQGGTSHAILSAVLSAPPLPLRSLRADVPAELEGLVHRLLAKDADDRTASAAEVLQALGATPAATARTGPALAAPRQSTLSHAGERRQVTVLACIIGGTDALVERCTPEQADQLLAAIDAAAAEVAMAHDGFVHHADAKGVVLLFGVPVAQEDDAGRAVRAAWALHQRTAALANARADEVAHQVRLHSGVHIGPAVVHRQREGRFRLTGAAADVAGQLAAAAAPDTILVSPELRRMVAGTADIADAPPLRLPGQGAPLTPGVVRGVAEGRGARSDVSMERSPFVGRVREGSTLAQQLEAAQRGTGGVVALVGEAGVGKSRLLHELRAVAATAQVRVVIGRCDPHRATTPFFPVAQAVHELLGVERAQAPEERHAAVVAAVHAADSSLETALPLVLALLGIPSQAHPVAADLRGDLFQTAMAEAAVALFTLAAQRQPLLLLLEDWHWADEASRATLRQLVEVAAAAPLCVVVTARPEGAADWAGLDAISVLPLAPLDGTATAAIAQAMFGTPRVADDLLARLHERTGGNPFFVEELCVALREEGVVQLIDGEARVVQDGAALLVPGTVQGVLRTRIDRLDGGALDALRVASVIGRDFTRGVLDDVVGAHEALGPVLDRLKGSGLVQQVAVVPEPTYRFRHALTQEVAYDSLLEHQRATLHGAVGRAIESRHAAQLDKHVDRLAHHFALAESWVDAVRYGLRAADRAMALSQNADVMAVLERAELCALRVADEAQRRDLHADVLLRQERLCETLGLRTRQLALVETLIALLAPHGPSSRLAEAYLRLGDASTLLRRYEAAERALGTARQIALELGDAALERGALRSLALLQSHMGAHAEAIATLEQVLAPGREAGDRQGLGEAGDLASMANVYRAMGQPTRALELLQAAMDRTDVQVNPTRYGALLNVMGTIYRDLGDYDQALAHYQRTAPLMTRTVYASFTLPGIAYIQLQRGAVDEALATYREAAVLNRRARYADGTANACRSLGEVLMGLERYDEAVAPLTEAAGLFRQLEDGHNERLIHRRLGTVHERRGAHPEARAAWETLRSLAAAAGELGDEADALEGLGRADRRLGAPAESVVASYGAALSLAARAGDAKRELRLHNALGIVHWERSAYAEAVRHYESALRLCRATDDRVHEGLILNSLGVSLYKLRRFDEARIALAEGAHAAQAASEPQLQAHALGTLADVCLASGRLEEALASVDRSIALRRTIGDRRGEGWMCERRARVLLARGVVDEARQAAAAAAAVAREVADDALSAAVAALEIPEV